MSIRLWILCLLSLIALWLPSQVFAQVSANVLVQEGDVVGGSTIDSLNQPFVNGNGEVGFNAALADGTRSIWFNGVEIFNSADAAPDVLTGGEGTMGFGNSGQFIYSPAFNGEDAVWDQNGLVLVENTQAPGFAPGINSTFHSRPTMTDDGTAYWVSGFNDGAGGTSSIGRMLYRRNTDTTIDVVIRAGDVIDGLEVATGSGISFDYGFSADNANSILEVNLDTGSTADDGRLLVNSSVIAAEGSATGQGDNWDNFDHMSINNAGDFLFSGDTDGASTVDEFIAYNGNIELRQGDALAGGILEGFVDGVSLNEDGEVAFIWELNSGSGALETLFYGQANDLISTQAIASVGDELDIDNDGLADWILTDFNSGLGPGIGLGENGLIFVEVDLESLDRSTNIEAIVSFNTVAIPEPASLAVLVLGASLMVRRRRN